MLVHATDTDQRWCVTLGPDGIDTTRGDGLADATLSGRAADVYRSVWNRGDDAVDLTGDPDALAVWHDNHRVRWS